MDNITVGSEYFHALERFFEYAFDNGYVGSMLDDIETDDNEGGEEVKQAIEVLRSELRKRRKSK